MMIYNPVDGKFEVTIEMFRELLTEDNIKAIKESTSDITNVIQL